MRLPLLRHPALALCALLLRLQLIPGLRWRIQTTGTARARCNLMRKTERKQHVALLESTETELAGRLGNRDGIEVGRTADPLDEVRSAGERELAMIRNLHHDSNLRKARIAL